MILEKFKKTIEKYDMLKRGDKLLVGVSGGPDSVCLLLLLKKIQRKTGLALHMVYVNHNLRKKEAKKEEEFVKQLAEKLDIPVSFRSIDVRGYAKLHKTGTEESGRELRYRTFLKLAEKLKATKIAVAHTASDQAETIIMRFLRGSGTEGMAGIPPVRQLKRNISIIRPLIETEKEEILGFLKKNKERFCMDSSNTKPVYSRNRVRLELLPYLENKYNRNVKEAVMRLAEILREENRVIDDESDRAVKRVARRRNKNIFIDFIKLLEYNKGLQRRIIYKLAGSNISLENVDSVLALAAGRTGGRVMLPHGIIVRKDYKYLVFSCGRDRQAGKKEGERKIKIPGRTRFGNSCLSARFVRKVSRFNDGKNKVYFDAAKIEKENLMVRTRKEGDRFRPFGMAGTKKLKDLFIDEKVGIAERDSIPLLVEGETILWVVGLRRSGYAPVSGSAKKILELKFEKDRIK